MRWAWTDQSDNHYAYPLFGWPWWAGYPIALIVQAIFIVAMLAIDPYFPLGQFPIFYILESMAIAYLFGPGPTAVIIITGWVSFEYLFGHPMAAILIPKDPEGWAGLTAYLLGTTIGSVAALVARASRFRIERLADVLQRYRLLAENALDIVLLLDINGRIFEANHAAELAYGYSRSQLRSMNVTDLRVGTDQPSVPTLMREAESGGVMFETVHRRRDGNTFPVEISSRGAVFGDEHILLSIVRDISERKRTEELLTQAKDAAQEAADHEAAARATLKAIMDTVPVGLVTVDPETWSINYYNRKAEEIAGGPLTGTASTPEADTYQMLKPDGSLFPPDELPLLGSLLRGERISNVELIIRRRNGSEVNALVNTAPVFDTHGKVVSAVAALDDITELVQLRKTIQNQLDLVQRALVPPTPSIGPGYEVAAVYIPAFIGQQIGGDFYDLFTTETGQAGILIGDVSGKGLEAASLAANTRSTIHAFAYETSSSGEALIRANSVIYPQQITFEKFVTVFLAIMDLPTGDICYSIGGHPPAAICSASGGVSFLTEGDLPIGLWDRQEFRQTGAHLDPGDRLLFYTDGILEAHHNGALFGTEGIERILCKCASKNSNDLITELVNAAKEWGGGRLHDDVALLVVHRLE